MPNEKEGGNLSPQGAQSLRQDIISARKKARELNAKIENIHISLK